MSCFNSLSLNLCYFILKQYIAKFTTLMMDNIPALSFIIRFYWVCDFVGEGYSQILWKLSHWNSTDSTVITLMFSVKRRKSSDCVACTVLGWGTLIGAPPVLGCIGTVLWPRVTGGFLWRDDPKVVTGVTGIEEAVKKIIEQWYPSIIKENVRVMLKGMF